MNDVPANVAQRLKTVDGVGTVTADVTFVPEKSFTGKTPAKSSCSLLKIKLNALCNTVETGNR